MGRIVQSVIEVLSTYENHGLGWRYWPDRVFYTLDDGEVKSLAQIWVARPPLPAVAFTSCMRLVRTSAARGRLFARTTWRAGQVAL